MTIMLVGGGSGGHITPLLAIARHLKSKNPSVQVIAISERSGKFASLFSSGKDIDTLHFISAGKLRRFHGERWWNRITDFKRNLLNLRDMFLFMVGFMQSFWLLVRHRPQIVFIKGGYLGVPVGLSAWILRIPYITHDSDALAGLSNRLIGRGASLHAVGMPKEAYSYPASKMVFIGIPIGEDFQTLSKEQIREAKTELDIPTEAKVLMITGGSNGAQRLNIGLQEPLQALLKHYSDLWVIHQFGAGNEGLYDEYTAETKDRIIAKPFLSPMSAYSAAADLIITRAGATAVAEFAAQAKACVVVPNPYLTGGHQLQNAKVLAKAGAICVLQEQGMQNSSDVAKLISTLLDKPEKRLQLGFRLQQSMPSNAAEKLADLLLKQASPDREQAS